MMIWVAGIALMAYHLTMMFTHIAIGAHRKQGRYGYVVANWLCVTLAAYLLVAALK